MVKEERKDKGPKEEDGSCWEGIVKGMVMVRKRRRKREGRSREGQKQKRRGREWCSKARGTRIYREENNFSWRNM